MNRQRISSKWALACARATLFLTAPLCGPTLAADWHPPEVTTRVTDAGTYTIDAKGFALYTYARDDKPGVSTCVKECIAAWPALAAPDGVSAQEPWSVITRDDGARQWALNGKPLYRYVRDTLPGHAQGDRVGNAWTLAFAPLSVPPGLAVRSLFAGRTLVDGRGHTLYVRADDKPCDRPCQKTWTPVAAPLAAGTLGPFSVMAQPDGTPQWAYKGERLFAHTDDYVAGLVRSADPAWRAVVLEPAPPLPAWVTIQNSDWGEVYADQHGMTLYTFAGDMQKTRELLCNDQCMAVWKTVAAAERDQPSGEWAPLPAPAGGKLWAYKGSVVYVHTRDREPGAVGGDKWAAGSGGGGGGFMPIVLRRDYEAD
jgi:predicted lipoprotein with Yx(FWY)xxD motif